MRGVFLLVFSSCLVYCKALECGLKTNDGQHLRDALTLCVKDNKTIESIMEMAMSIESESESSEDAPKISSTTAKPSSAKGRRIKRAARAVKKLQSEAGKGKTKEEPVSSTTEQASTTATEENTSEVATQTTEASTEVCLLQCVFEKMEMTDSDGYPEQSKIIEGLLQNATGKQLRDFLQESAEECFQQADSDDPEDSCTYTTKLVTCLAEKGRTNCADWPAGNLPF